MKKRMLSFFLALCLLAMTACGRPDGHGERENAGLQSVKAAEPSLPAQTLASAFSDVPAGADYAGAVAWCRENGVLNGVGGGRFDPSETLTRAMLVTALYWAEGEPPVTNTLSFTDTQADAWYANGVAWANERGLVKGYGNGLFGTNDPVSLEQLEIILGRYAGDAPVWKGDPAKARAVTRAEVAVALYHTFNKEEGEPMRKTGTEENPGDFNLAAKTVTLNSGYEMPINGLGTYSLHGDVCINSVKAALKSGVRLFDTASAYGNEEEVGQALREGMEELGIKREEIFVITKIYPGGEMADPETSIQACLDRLDLGYVDMMLLHHPDPNDVKAYQAMEKFVADGKIRSLGLSNWYVEELERFLPQVSVKPALVQNEIHPYYQENDVIPYIQERGIAVQGWYPLGGRGHTGELLGDETISAIARAHNVSSAQIILRWNLQKGVVVIPGSSNPDHIKENTELYGFTLTDAEMARINALDRNEKHDWY